MTDDTVFSEVTVGATDPLDLLARQDRQAPRYQTGELLGKGGMGLVYQATDTALDREVALKVLKKDLTGDARCLNQFVQEARSLGVLEHPCIPPVYEVGLQADGSPFFAMKLVRGTTLSEWIETSKGFPVDLRFRYSFRRRAQIMIHLCEALQFAHSRGFVHCDIKPANVMLGDSGEVQLLDWGVALHPGEDPKSSPRGGTLRFCAPEILSNPAELKNVSSDIFALGLLMYECFCLTPAFPQQDQSLLMSALSQHKTLHPESIQQKGQDRVPKEFGDIIRRATHPDPKNRYTTARQFAEGIRSAIDGQAPVVCACTGMKRVLTSLDSLVNNYKGLFVFLLIFWLISPILMLFYLWLSSP